MLFKFDALCLSFREKPMAFFMSHCHEYSGIGAEFSLITMQGILYDAGAASDRLRVRYPRVWADLRNHNLDMVYFLIEKPMQKYLDVMRLNNMKLYVQLRI